VYEPGDSVTVNAHRRCHRGGLEERVSSQAQPKENRHDGAIPVWCTAVLVIFAIMVVAKSVA